MAWLIAVFSLNDFALTCFFANKKTGHTPILINDIVIFLLSIQFPPY